MYRDCAGKLVALERTIIPPYFHLYQYLYHKEVRGHYVIHPKCTCTGTGKRTDGVRTRPGCMRAMCRFILGVCITAIVRYERFSLLLLPHLLRFCFNRLSPIAFIEAVVSSPIAIK